MRPRADSTTRPRARQAPRARAGRPPPPRAGTAAGGLAPARADAAPARRLPPAPGRRQMMEPAHELAAGLEAPLERRRGRRVRTLPHVPLRRPDGGACAKVWRRPVVHGSECRVRLVVDRERSATRIERDVETLAGPA